MALVRTLVKGATSRRWMTTAAALPGVAEGSGGSRRKGMERVPVYVLAGMVTTALGFGLHTAKQQLLYAPDVHVRKSKRETLPEVVDPDLVVDESRKFVDKSFFRKVAHVHELDVDGVGGDLLSRKPRVETLKEVGVDPKQT